MPNFVSPPASATTKIPAEDKNKTANEAQLRNN
jgi:hypothetical protein